MRRQRDGAGGGGESKTGAVKQGKRQRRQSLLLRSIDGKSEQPYKVTRRKSMAQFDPADGMDQVSNKSILLVDDVPHEQAMENHQLLLNSLSSIGVSMPSYIMPRHLADGDPHETLEVIYRLLQKHAQRTCSLSKTRELLALCEDARNKDEVGMLRSLTGGEVLLKWMSKHAGATIGNFGADLSGGDTLLRVLGAAGGSSGAGASTVDTIIATVQERDMVAAQWLAPIHLEGPSAAAEEDDMSRVRELLCSEMFSFNHGLILEEVEQAEFTDEEMYGSDDMDKEEKTYCTWITSLVQNIEGTKPISHLIEDLRNGELLLKIVALISQDSPLAGEKVKGKTGIVEWKKISLATTSRYKMGENINYLLTLCKQMGLNMVNIGSADLLERNSKILKSLLYRLMRWHSLSIVTRAIGHGAKNVGDVDESEVIEWVNQKIENSEEGSSEMVSFKDKENRNSVLFMDLLEAMKVGVDCFGGCGGWFLSLVRKYICACFEFLSFCFCCGSLFSPAFFPPLFFFV